MIENIKARLHAKRFNIWTEQIDDKRKPDAFLHGYWVYDGKVYFGNRFLVFFESAQNQWYIKEGNK